MLTHLSSLLPRHGLLDTVTYYLPIMSRGVNGCLCEYGGFQALCLYCNIVVECCSETKHAWVFDCLLTSLKCIMCVELLLLITMDISVVLPIKLQSYYTHLLHFIPLTALNSSVYYNEKSLKRFLFKALISLSISFSFKRSQLVSTPFAFHIDGGWQYNKCSKT